MPEEALPTEVRGKASYTVNVDGKAISVLLKDRAFFCRLNKDGYKQRVPWHEHESIDAAWAMAKMSTKKSQA
eukprot:6675037-Pyramimonas_sp.AAC.1